MVHYCVTAVSESLRMPFFFRPGESMPNEPVVRYSSVTDIMPAGDSGAQRDTVGFQPELNGVTYKDIPFNVDASTLRIEALTEWMQVARLVIPILTISFLVRTERSLLSQATVSDPSL